MLFSHLACALLASCMCFEISAVNAVNIWGKGKDGKRDDEYNDKPPDNFPPKKRPRSSDAEYKASAKSTKTANHYNDGTPNKSKQESDETPPWRRGSSNSNSGNQTSRGGNHPMSSTSDDHAQAAARSRGTPAPVTPHDAFAAVGSSGASSSTGAPPIAISQELALAIQQQIEITLETLIPMVLQRFMPQWVHGSIMASIDRLRNESQSYTESYERWRQAAGQMVPTTPTGAHPTFCQAVAPPPIEVPGHIADLPALGNGEIQANPEVTASQPLMEGSGSGSGNGETSNQDNQDV